MLSLRVAAIACVMAVVASASVMAQTTGTIPPPAPPSQPPPTANQYSSNEIIDAGHRFFGSVSRDIAEIVEKDRYWLEPMAISINYRMVQLRPYCSGFRVFYIGHEGSP